MQEIADGDEREVTGDGQGQATVVDQPRVNRLRGVIELLATVGVAIGLALLVQAVLVKPYKIPSGSMIPTLAIGQRILVNRLDTHPALGDVVVFHPPAGAELGDEGVCGSAQEGFGLRHACDKDSGQESTQTYVKRVVGLPGDHLRIIGGRVYRNGVEERGSYLRACDTGPSYCRFPAEITVPPHDYYMMGDNRADSLDSRFWGPVPRAWLIGKVFFTYWPPDRIGFF